MVDSDNLSLRGSFPLIRKDSVTYMHGLAVYKKEGLPFIRDLSQGNSVDSHFYFQLVLLLSMSYFCSLHRSPFSSLRTVFDAIPSNKNEVLSINHLLMHLSKGL